MNIPSIKQDSNNTDSKTHGIWFIDFLSYVYIITGIFYLLYGTLGLVLGAGVAALFTTQDPTMDISSIGGVVYASGMRLVIGICITATGIFFRKADIRGLYIFTALMFILISDVLYRYITQPESVKWTSIVFVVALNVYFWINHKKFKR